ncbi:ATP-binding protein [Catenuloplanes japonicus]|uniref:ATP-binding protein n=1 Tax=Catenuloplanes japonicus TaxID=33876 RepID=UPI00052513D9|nr:ATP-binding protein [Catenuloplanes japonicus]
MSEYLVAALDVLRLRIAGAKDLEITEAETVRDEIAKDADEPPPPVRIAERFGLTGFERDTLLLCAGAELDGPFAEACAKAQQDPGQRYATFALALAMLPEPDWAAVSPAGALRRLGLVSLDQPSSPVASPLRIAERVLHALLGVDYLDTEIAPLTESIEDAGVLPGALGAAAEEAAASAYPLMIFGRPVADLRNVAAAAHARAGLRPVLLNAGALPADPAARDRIARLCERETLLASTGWIIDLDGVADRARQAALDLARRLDAPVILLSREPVAGIGPRASVVAVGEATATELRRVWQDALPALPGPWVDRIAGQFALGADDVQAIARRGPLAPEAVWELARARARPAQDGLLQRIAPRADWDDVVLPDTQRQTLRQIAGHLRHRLTVLEDWGFGGRGAGTAALFAGPSGTGKTLAAEVIAGALRLDLYRVDLSQTVSKYIGETEKHLSRIFDAAEAGGGVLLFDEADALFGKRSEVRDSHDRYANLEVGYLLQRIEAYRGLAILTTNLKDSLDQAFLRRLRFVVHFPFPDAAARAEIWRRAFPARTPIEGVDFAALARLSIPGGTIRSIALAAAFLAAEAGGPVRMDHVLTATRTEYAKLERPLTAAETAAWR